MVLSYQLIHFVDDHADLTRVKRGKEVYAICQDERC